jgi:hypothetical protein
VNLNPQTEGWSQVAGCPEWVPTVGGGYLKFWSGCWTQKFFSSNIPVTNTNLLRVHLKAYYTGGGLNNYQATLFKNGSALPKVNLPDSGGNWALAQLDFSANFASNDAINGIEFSSAHNSTLQEVQLEVSFCGDGYCANSDGLPETQDNCPVDCPHSCNHNGVCDPGENMTCGDCFAVCNDDELCDPGRGETHDNCPMDCPDLSPAVCGNGTCQPGETAQDCPADCNVCGDGFCWMQEEWFCPEDC